MHGLLLVAPQPAMQSGGYRYKTAEGGKYYLSEASYGSVRNGGDASRI